MNKIPFIRLVEKQEMLSTSAHAQPRLRQTHRFDDEVEHQQFTLFAETVEVQMEKALQLIDPMLVDETSNDEAMAVICLVDEEIWQPLNKHHVRVLACALYVHPSDRGFTYDDVLKLTDRYQGRAMNVSMVYSTIKELVDRELLVVDGEVVNSESDRRSQAYSITKAGKRVLSLSIVRAHASSKDSSYAAA